VLLDTDVFSFLMRPHDTRSAIYAKRVAGKLIAVSFVTVGELLFGAKKRKWGATKVAELERRLRGAVIVPYDRALCDTYGRLKAETRAKGITVTDNDMWIAASAVRHNIPLVSHNRRHFECIPDLVLISEEPVIKEITSQSTLPLEDGS
jgi:tRNA(fMet)-specific endonuclease VapC